jgi:phenylacetaldehyde dehydrogenase
MGLAAGSAVMPEVRQFFLEDRKMLIDGQWVEAALGKTFEVYDSAAEEVLCRVAEGDGEDIDRAVESDRAAFDTGPRSRLRPSDRGRRSGSWRT